MIKKHRRQFLAAAIVLGVLALVYLIAVPTSVARQYTRKFEPQLMTVEEHLNEVAKTAEMSVFNDPGIDLDLRQHQLNEAITKVQQTQDALKKLGSANQLTALPATGFIGEYRTASVLQKQADDITSQSEQVLTDYKQILQYLTKYTEHQSELSKGLGHVNSIKDFNSLKGRGDSLISTASNIEAHTADLSVLSPPADFSQLNEEALKTFEQAAVNLDSLGNALNNYSDPAIYSAVSQVETIALKNEVDDKNLLVDQASKSPILRQVIELPEKVEYVQGR